MGSTEHSMFRPQTPSLHLVEILLGADVIPDDLAQVIVRRGDLLRDGAVNRHLVRPEFHELFPTAYASLAGRVPEYTADAFELFAAVHAIRDGADPSVMLGTLAHDGSWHLANLPGLVEIADQFPDDAAIAAFLEAMAVYGHPEPRRMLGVWAGNARSGKWMLRAAQSMSQYVIGHPKDTTARQLMMAVVEKAVWHAARDAVVDLGEYMSLLTAGSLQMAAWMKMTRDSVVTGSQSELFRGPLIDGLILPFLAGQMRGQVTRGQVAAVYGRVCHHWDRTDLGRVHEAAREAALSPVAVLRNAGGWLAERTAKRLRELRTLEDRQGLDVALAAPLKAAAKMGDPKAAKWAFDALHAGGDAPPWEDVLRTADLVGDMPLRDLVSAVTTTLS